MSFGKNFLDEIPRKGAIFLTGEIADMKAHTILACNRFSDRAGVFDEGWIDVEDDAVAINRRRRRWQRIEDRRIHRVSIVHGFSNFGQNQILLPLIMGSRQVASHRSIVVTRRANDGIWHYLKQYTLQVTYR